MTRQVYVNGAYLPYRDATIHVEDRGLQFADSVYEVFEIWNGVLVDATRHIARLLRSLNELAIAAPRTEASLRLIFSEVIRRNRVRHGLLYVQVTRGVAPRDFLPPNDALDPTIICFARRLNPDAREQLANAGIAVITMDEMRWARCDIKTVMLLPAVLAKQEAARHGAKEAWFIDHNGYVTEGASSNAWIVTSEGELQTRSLGREILPGITRHGVIDGLRNLGLTLKLEAFSRTDALAASEAFITSATGTVMPVVKIDGHVIGSGKPGPITRDLRARFHEFVEV